MGSLAENEVNVSTGTAKEITGFRFVHDGLVLDLKDKPSSVFIKRNTGVVFIDEGYGEGSRINNRALPNSLIKQLRLSSSALVIEFMDGPGVVRTYTLGHFDVNNPKLRQEAGKWHAEAEQCLLSSSAVKS